MELHGRETQPQKKKLSIIAGLDKGESMADHKTKVLEMLADTPEPLREEATEATATEGIDYGVVIIPPKLDDHNEELDSYPADYLEYCKDRMRAYKEANGELPKYSKGTEDR